MNLYCPTCKLHTPTITTKTPEGHIVNYVCSWCGHIFDITPKQEMTLEEKYNLCLKYLWSEYHLKDDTLVSLQEAIENEDRSKQAEMFLRLLGEFKSEENK